MQITCKLWLKISEHTLLSSAENSIKTLLSISYSIGTNLALFTMNITEQKEDLAMLGWAITFFIIAIIAAVFGFGGIAGAATGIAQFLFFVFVALLVISLVANALRGKAPRV